MGSDSKRGIKGKQAPSWRGGVTEWYQLPHDKRSLDVTDYRDKVLFLYFFQSWCPSCHRVGFPTLQRLQDVFGSDPKVEIVAIQAVNDGWEYNTAEAAQMCLLKYGLQIPVGQSSGGGHPFAPSDLLKQYNVQEAPWTAIIDQKGVVRYNRKHVNTLDAIQIVNVLKDDWNGAVRVADVLKEDQTKPTKRIQDGESRRSRRARSQRGKKGPSQTKGSGGLRKSKSTRSNRNSKSTRKLFKPNWLSFRSR